MTLILLFICLKLQYGSDMLSLCITFMASTKKTSNILCVIEETPAADKTSIIILVFGIKEKNCIVKTLYIVCLLLLGERPNNEPLSLKFNNLNV